MKLFIKLLIAVFVVCALLFAANRFAQNKLAELSTDVGEIMLDDTNAVRYENMLIKYDTDVERNSFGYEILVESSSGFVIDKGDIVDLDTGTYILSGHGTAADFLANVDIGDIVEIEGNNVKITRNLFSSSLKAAELENNRANKIIKQKKKNLYDIDTDSIELIDERISVVEKDIKKDIWEYILWSEVDEESVVSKTSSLLELIDQKYYATVEAKSVEIRGLWHRPNASGISERSLSGVREFVKRIQELGINTLYVETFWHGMTTYYSDYLGLAHPQMARYNYGEYGNDYIAALIGECHKAGIEVHAWFETLDSKSPYDVMHEYIKPEWILYNHDGDNSEGFLDPTNPEVKEFLLNIISEMFEKYDFDGISYDYIRYSESGDFDGYRETGFSENAINLFCSQYGFSGVDFVNAVAGDESLRNQWHEFKCNSISSLVKAMSDHIRSIEPDAIISTSPYGNVEQAKSIYMQDVAAWCEMRSVDVILPMIYTTDTDFYVSTVESFNVISDNALQVPGVYSLYLGLSFRQTEMLLDAICPITFGNSIFASQNVISRNQEYADEVLKILSTSSHRGGAVSPTSDVNKVFSAFKATLLDRCERIYSKKMSKSEIEIVKSFCMSEEIKMESLTDIADTLKKIESFRVRVGGFKNSTVIARIEEQIDYTYKILDLSLTRRLIALGYWDVATMPQRPDVYSLDFD